MSALLSIGFYRRLIPFYSREYFYDALSPWCPDREKITSHATGNIFRPKSLLKVFENNSRNEISFDRRPKFVILRSSCKSIMAVKCDPRSELYFIKYATRALLYFLL